MITRETASNIIFNTNINKIFVSIALLLSRFLNEEDSLTIWLTSSFPVLPDATERVGDRREAHQDREYLPVDQFDDVTPINPVSISGTENKELEIRITVLVLFDLEYSSLRKIYT